MYLGNTAAAVDLYQRILDIDPGHAQAHWGLAGARRADDRAHIDTMRRILATPGLHPRTRAFLNYAIGKECEDIAAWDEAFDAFASGAAARRQTVEYDEANEIATFAALSELFSADWLDGRQDGTATGPAPIFIVGQPRTGTTLIERILAAHSQVHAAGELQHFTLGIRRLSDYRDPRRFTPELYARARNLDPADLGRTYLETTRRLQGNRPRFIDKLPQNYLNVPLILAALPHARILHLTRDPMDACFASFKQLFADAYLHSYRQDEMARHHVRYHQLMSIWRQRFPGRFLDVSYEATVQDVEGVTRALLDWLQLPFEDACLNFHAQSGAVATCQCRAGAGARAHPLRRTLATLRRRARAHATHPGHRASRLKRMTRPANRRIKAPRRSA
ncbi:MAG: sulfotransferase [Pseudomonadales bacterium]